MDSRLDVVIVSAFARGHFLAERLTREGLKVGLIDVTNSLGTWEAEDWEGPFGIFKSSALETEEWDYLASRDHLVGIERGFVVWLSDGPVELRGPLTEFSLAKRQISYDCLEIMREWDKASEKVKAGQFQYLRGRPYSEVWLSSLAQQYGSNAFHSNAEAIGRDRLAPIFSPFYVKRVSEKSLSQGLQYCAKAGVQVFSPAQLMDLSLQGGGVDGVEISSERSGVVGGSKFIWMLSSQETEHCSERVRDLLFPKGALEPEWFWVRYRLEWSGTDLIDVLPIRFLMVQDIQLPWTHSNFICMQRTLQMSDVDAWVRIPIIQRGEKGYLEKLSEEILAELERRVPSLKAKVIQMPQEFSEDLLKLGPPRHPVYNPTQLQKLKRASPRNLFYLGPEDWRGLDWTAQFEAQRSVVEQLVIWSKKEKLKKGEVSDSTLHPG